jgi:hypothetical protein
LHHQWDLHILKCGLHRIVWGKDGEWITETSEDKKKITQVLSLHEVVPKLFLPQQMLQASLSATRKGLHTATRMEAHLLSLPLHQNPG